MAERETDPNIQLVTFLMDGEEYGVDVMQIREIICVPDIAPSPNAKPHVEGMITLRGSVIPVVSLRKRLGLPQIEHDLDTRIAIASCESGEVGIIIDRIADVVKVKRSSVKPAAGDFGQHWVTGVLNLERLVVVIDLEKLEVV